MKKIVIANNKGGVAKTTTAYNIASYYAKKGKKILVIDCDPQGNLTDALGIDPNEVDCTIFDALTKRNIKEAIIKLPQAENFYLVPSNLESERVNITLSSQLNRESVLKKILKEVEDEFDMCIMDTSPSLSILTLNAIVAADSIYLTLRAGYFELRGAGLLISTINEIKEDLNDRLEVKGLILTQYDIRTSLSTDSKEQLEEYFKSAIMNTVIRQNVDLAKAPANAQDIFSYAPLSNGARDYEDLALEILEREGIKW
ncbi:ParA family protein [Leptotrichia sp. OH3620_COT-345]|uniref:ParA family protein n=1 Tax=Leptotrichia sp. OH3620_COT-345 TaxID=2491048 RepID=UPI000F652147|nr:AAA family ATPase [Leptotrichia sp. OH3620_COT-345]RRD40739.1 ParA family protein [Leptotrichia sp. OH3620_COT-345]